ncbi:hypothetical protein AHAS_Ahas18G0149800 [Arachis hypogaea]
MSRNKDKEPLFDFDPEIERTARRCLQQARAYRATKSIRDNSQKEVDEFVIDGNPNNNAINADVINQNIQVQIFYDGVSETGRMSLDNSVGGSLHMKKTPDEAMKLIEIVANNQNLYSSERASVKKEVMELDTLDVILAQNKAMSQQINAIIQHLNGMQSFQLKPPLVGVNTISPDTKPKFGVGSASSTKEGDPKKKVPRGWRNKKIPTEEFSPGMKNRDRKTLKETQNTLENNPLMCAGAKHQAGRSAAGLESRS